ncbi:MAG: EAL domain-containing protein [Deltaproteobacteria bacterium]|nr:EAL domain-containing protein [Deltaproteobacteria bacterium]
MAAGDSTGGTERRLGEGLDVLVVDDDSTVREFLKFFLEREGFHVACAERLEEARELARGNPCDLLMTDMNLPDGNGLELAREMGELQHDCEVVLMSAYANVDSTVRAIQLGVADFLLKPFDEVETVRRRLRRVLELQGLRRANRAILEDLQDKNALLESLVIRDPLTTLYNHAFFHDSVVRELNRSTRHHLEFAILFLDVDDFKGINDSRGHLFGDEVLKKLSAILRGEHQEKDSSFRLRKEDIAARYGGDEFALVLPSTGKDGATLKAEQLRKVVEAVDFGLAPERLTVSIGVSAYPDDGSDHLELISCADASLYAAKRTGRNRVMAYSESIRSEEEGGERGHRVVARHATALGETLHDQSLDYLYQPIIDLPSQRVFAYEALCRPTHPVFPSPVQLLQTAQLTGRLIELGRVMRERAILPIEELPEESLLFVNLHPMEVNDELLHDADSRARPHAHRIVYEITETVALRDHEHLRSVLARLREAGFRIALDDLGAGYAGLSTLAALRPDFVKIDMSLVRGINQDSGKARLLRHILDYAHGEGMQVIAEGVETAEERDTVLELGCHLLHGYLFGHPSPPYLQQSFDPAPEDPEAP